MKANLNQARLIAALPPVMADRLLEGSEAVHYAAGAPIPRPGRAMEPGILLEGLARVYLTAPDGRSATYRYAVKGDTIGLLQQFGGGAANIEAVLPTTVLEFDADRFERLLKTEPRVAQAVSEETARAFASIHDILQSLAFGSVRERLAVHLTVLAVGRDEAGHPVAQVTHEQLAAAVGTVRRVIARELRVLREQGLVATEKGRIVILDPKRMTRESGRADS